MPDAGSIVEHSTGEWLEMVDRLSHAPDWPNGDPPIATLHTHISAVLLGQRHVLKLKKPVDFGFLDYTTLEKRRMACQAEVDLNRRLCPDTYLGVRAIIEVSGQPRLSGWVSPDDQGGGLELVQPAPVFDYGVWMRRLPSDRMLDQMLARDEVTETIIDRVAARIAAFHQQARRGPAVDYYAHPGSISKNWEENFAQTVPFVGRTIMAREFDCISGSVNRWMRDRADLFKRRVAGGSICDGHGDMRCESICIADEICIFDCIEFNEGLRCGDVASEVAFLAMDLDARGRPDLGYYFTECYNTQMPDTEMFAVLPFYRCYRAYVRGKVLSFRLDESEFTEADKASAAGRARSYFHLARRYASPLEHPTVIAVAGLSGTGKTSLARAIAGELGLRVVSTDAVRKSIFGPASRAYQYGEGPYTAEGNRQTYEKFMDSGRRLLDRYGGVIMDATFRNASDRKNAANLAAQAGARFRVVECKLAPDLVRSRLGRRAACRESLSDATWTTYLRQCGEFDPIEGSRAESHLALDTARSLVVTSHTATDWLRENDT